MPPQDLCQPETASTLPKETVGQYLRTASQLEDDPAIHRLMLGIIQQRIGHAPCAACADPIGRDIMTGKIKVGLMRITRCVDPRCVTADKFRLGVRDALVDGIPGLLFKAYRPGSTFTIYTTDDLYLGWMRDARKVAHYGEFGSGHADIVGRPTFILLSHSDCGAAAMLSGDPASWPDRPLGNLMCDHWALREASLENYGKMKESGELKDVSFADFLAVQAARQATFRKIEAVHALKYPGENPVVIPLHYDMGNNYYLVDPWQPYGLTLLIGEEQLMAAGLDCTHRPEDELVPLRAVGAR